MIAEAIGGDYFHMLQRAGYLPHDDDNHIPAHLKAMVLEVQALWREINAVDPEAAASLARTAVIQAEAFQAVVKAQSRTNDKAQQLTLHP